MSLHVHSEYSALDGWSTCDEIGERIANMGCKYCGLTDHGVVAGHLEFDRAMRKRGINPVFGCELYHGIAFGEKLGRGARDQAHLIALAMTDEGLRNLWKLVNATANREKFHHVGRVSCDDLIKYQKGIHFTSACPLGHVPQGLLKENYTMLNWYQEHFEKFSLEVTTYPSDVEWRDRDSDDQIYTPRMINEALVDIADERGIMVTYGDDGHYAWPEQFPQHNAYLAAQTRESVDTPEEERKMWHPEGALCIKDRDEVCKALAYLGEQVEEIIRNTEDVGTSSCAHLPEADRNHLPVFVIKDCPWISKEDRYLSEIEDLTTTDLFIELVEKGIQEHYSGGSNENEAWKQALHEIEVLIDDGLTDYFLMTWDLVQFCKANEIYMGPGRGSSAGSIVAYALGITDVDPLHYDLFFERFWNKGRASGFPDIDSDFARSRRGEIREYLIKRWGEDKVCSIGTIKRMKPLAVLNAMAEAFEISVPELNEVKKIVEETHDIDIHGTDQIGWDPELDPGKVIYVMEDVGEEINKWIDGKDKRKRYIEMCAYAHGRTENYGIHASGIVVSDIDLSDYAPAYLRGGKDEGIPATQFPMTEIEKLRLVKEDVLGLKTLDTLAEWERLTEPIRWSGMDRTKWPDDMWDLLEEGFVSGIFQVETAAGKSLAEKLRPRSIEDLGVLVALNRPGPQRDGIPNRYAARKEGRSEVTYPHPLLEDILEPTYGLFVYQEQIIRFMWALGYSLSDADAVRKILGKKKPEDLRAFRDGEGEWEGQGFIDKAIDKGFDEEAAHEVFKTIEGFASYSYNKSHAIAYAIISFRCLYAKWTHPIEYYIACIRTVEHSKRAKLTPQYIKEARRANIRVLPPDIRYSQAECAAHGDDIYFGFGDVKGVGAGGDLIVQLRDQGADISTPETLLADLVTFNSKMLEEKQQLLLEGELPEGWRSPKQLLNEKKIGLVELAGGWDDLHGGAELRDKQKRELEYLNVVLTDNTQEIIEQHTEDIAKCDSWDEAMQPWHEKITDEEIEAVDYRIPGIITNVKPTRTKRTNAAMGIITIEWGRHELSFACFSNKWAQAKSIFKPHHVGIFTIRHEPPSPTRGESRHYERGHLLK